MPDGNTRQSCAYYAGLRAWAEAYGVRIQERVRDGRVVGYYYPKEAGTATPRTSKGRQQ